MKSQGKSFKNPKAMSSNSKRNPLEIQWASSTNPLGDEEDTLKNPKAILEKSNRNHLGSKQSFVNPFRNLKAILETSKRISLEIQWTSSTNPLED